MTMKTRSIFMAALLLAASCTNTDYIDVDNVDPVLVMNAQISTANTSHMVILSNSTLSQLLEVNGANVSISVNGDAPITATEDNTEEEMYGYGLNNGTKYIFDYNFAPGDNVSIKVNNGSDPEVDAAVTVPKEPVIKKVEILHNVPHTTSDSMFDWSYGYGDYIYYESDDNPYPYDSWHELRVTLQDIPSEDSFYRIEVETEATLQDGGEAETTTRGVWLDNSSEPVLSSATSSNTGILDILSEESNSYNAFSDNVFKDKEYTLKLFYKENQVSESRHYYYHYDVEWTPVEVKDETTGQTYTKYEPTPLPEGVTYSSRMRIKLYSISHDQFIYIKALGLTDMAMFFSEPISIPSNVNGGMGFITIDNCKEVTLEY